MVAIKPRHAELDKIIARTDELQKLKQETTEQRRKQGALWTKQAAERERLDFKKWAKEFYPQQKTNPVPPPVPTKQKPAIKLIQTLPPTTKVTIVPRSHPAQLSPISPEDRQLLLQDLSVSPDQSPITPEREQQLLCE